MKSKMISIVVAGLFVTGTAIAEDKSWTGLKIGIGAGGSSSQAKTTNSGAHSFSESSDYVTSSDATSDSVTTNTFTSNNKFDPTSSTGTSNSYVESSSSGVIHGNYDDNTVLFTDPAGASQVNGTNYYNRDYSISEGFAGQAIDSLNLGRAGGFGTLDVTYDWQLSDSFVFGLTASANISSKQVAKGAASGYNMSGWNETLSYNVITNSSSSDGGGGGGGTTYSSVDEVGSSGFDSAQGQMAYTGMQSSFETGNSFDMGARFGFLPTNNTLLFVSGGFTVIKVNQNTTYTSATTTEIGDSSDSVYGESGTGNSYYHSVSKTSSGFKPGYFVGAGIETRLTDDVSLKLEYRYSDYGSMKSKGSSNNASIQDGQNGNDFEFYDSLSGGYNMTQKTDLTTQSIRAVLSYNF